MEGGHSMLDTLTRSSSCMMNVCQVPLLAHQVGAFWRTLSVFRTYNQSQPSSSTHPPADHWLVLLMASKLYWVNATIIVFVFVLPCIVFYCIVLYYSNGKQNVSKLSQS